MNKNNNAERAQVTLHILGTHVMWGVPKSHMDYSEDFAHAANANIENAPMPRMAPTKPKASNMNAVETETVVRLFGKK